MHPLLAQLARGTQPTGSPERDVPAFLRMHGKRATADHSAAVAAQARRIALRAGLDPDRAGRAAWLHDVSAPIPNDERVAAARALGLDVLPEEEAAPVLLHQKLSAVVARELFGERDEGVLAAIGCHTTLRPGATMLDKALFLADKTEWDLSGEPPYLREVMRELNRSLDDAIRLLLNYIWEHREALVMVHPWLREAYEEISQEGRGNAAR